MKRTIFLIVIICVILYFQYPYINYENNNYDILQFNNPNKSIFENMLSEKKISIFTNMPIDLTYKDIQPSYFTPDFVNLLNSNKDFSKIVYNQLDYYKIPLSISKSHKLMVLDKPSSLTFQNNYRLLLLNLKNTIKISLFYPSQKDNLYFNKNNISTIDFYNTDYEKFPKLNDVKFIEVLLHPYQMISIPFKWMYILNNIDETDTILLTYTNESIFSRILKR